MPRGAFSDVDVLREIHHLVEEEFGPSQIQRELERNRAFYGRVPSLSTITRLVREAKRTDPSDPWTLPEADPEEARLVLEVLPYIIESTDGRAWPTRDLAERLTRVRLAAPSIPPRQNYILARLYQHHEALGIDSRVLDLWLAVGAWESDSAARRFLQLLRLGRSEDEANDISLKLFVYAEVIGDPGDKATKTRNAAGSESSSSSVHTPRKESNDGKAAR
jgi:hypothetical protein